MKLLQTIRLGVGLTLLMPFAQLHAGEDFQFVEGLKEPFREAPNASDVSLESLVLPESSAGVADQLKAIHSMGDDIGTEEVGRLYAFLKSRGEEAGYKPPGLYALKNEAMNVLRKQSPPPGRLADVLIGVFDDSNQDLVVRDYAIQHLVAWCDWGAGADSADKSRSRETLLKASSEKSAIAGTALLGWHRLSAVDSAFGREWIEEFALKFARSNETMSAVRIAALQICAERNLNDVLAEAELLARTSTDIGLRVSAIAALGRLGNETHASLLRGMVSESEEPWQTAVQAALKRLSKKTEVPNWNPKST